MRRRRSDLVAQAGGERPGESLVIAHVDQQRAVAEYLGQRARPGRDHGHAGAHGLQRREAEPLVEGGEGQHCGTGKQRRQLELLQPAGANDPVAHLRRGNGRLQRLLAPPRRTGEDEGDVGLALGHRTEGPHQPRQVLPWLGRPDGQAEALHAGRKEPPQHRGGLRLGRDGQVGDAGVDDADAGWIGLERLDDLTGHESGIGVDPRAAVEGAPDQPGVGERRRHRTARDGAVA